MVGIAKTVAENYGDEELRDTFITISLDLYVLRFLSRGSLLSRRSVLTPRLGIVFSSSR